MQLFPQAPHPAMQLFAHPDPQVEHVLDLDVPLQVAEHPLQPLEVEEPLQLPEH